jgi:hypothetical protein
MGRTLPWRIRSRSAGFREFLEPVDVISTLNCQSAKNGKRAFRFAQNQLLVAIDFDGTFLRCRNV